MLESIMLESIMLESIMLERFGNICTNKFILTKVHVNFLLILNGNFTFSK